MSGALAPLWLEGMVMQPHHLQQLERSWTARLEDRVAGLVPGAWGLRSIAFDSSLLPLGRVGIVACHAVLPDGTVSGASTWLFRGPYQDTDATCTVSIGQTGVITSSITLGLPAPVTP